MMVLPFNKSSLSSSTESFSLAQVTQSVQNANDLQGAINAAVQRAAEARPKGTRKSYDPKQVKWKMFCDERKFDDGQLVTEAKLLLWLQSTIVPAGNSKKKARSAGEDEGAAAAPLCYRTIDGYVSAALDLFKQQQSLGTNSHAHPRGKALSSYLESMVREESKRKREEYEDRQAGTIQDGYSHEIFSRINHFYLSQPSLKQNASRNRLDHLLGHAILSRGETMRGAQLADLFTLPLPNEGAQQCHAVVLIMHQGKTNQFGRLEYGGCMRYKDVLECPQAALAIYLFERFHLAGEPFPSLKKREDWYDIYLLKHKNPTTALTYRAQYDNMAKVLDALKITSSKKTHLNRGGGARRAEDNGASEAQIRRAGRWVVEKMQGCYLTGLPRESMRAMAGFSTSPGTFHLARATIEPSASLQRQLFPEVDELLARVEAGDDHERDLAAQGFLHLLRYLRRVLLQDAVALRRTHPQLFMFTHPLFQSADFLSYEQHLNQALDVPEKPLSISITEALPEIAQFLNSMQNNQVAMAHLAQRTDERIIEVANMTRTAFNTISHQVQALSRKKVRVDVIIHQDSALPVSDTLPVSISTSTSSAVPPSATFGWPTSVPLPPSSPPLTTESVLRPPPPPSPVLGDIIPQTDHGSCNSIRMLDPAMMETGLDAQSTCTAAAALDERQLLTDGRTQSSDPLFTLLASSSTSVQPTATAVYHLSRSLSTITDVWKEWDSGLNGGVSVRSLEGAWGARWRAGTTERKFFSNRKRLWDAIEKRADEERITCAQSAERLEMARVSLGKKSVDWCQKNLPELLKASALSVP